MRELSAIIENAIDANDNLCINEVLEKKPVLLLKDGELISKLDNASDEIKKTVVTFFDTYEKKFSTYKKNFPTYKNLNTHYQFIKKTHIKEKLRENENIELQLQSLDCYETFKHWLSSQPDMHQNSIKHLFSYIQFLEINGKECPVCFEDYGKAKCFMTVCGNNHSLCLECLHYPLLQCPLCKEEISIDTFKLCQQCCTKKEDIQFAYCTYCKKLCLLCKECKECAHCQKPLKQTDYGFVFSRIKQYTLFQNLSLDPLTKQIFVACKLQLNSLLGQTHKKFRAEEEKYKKKLETMRERIETTKQRIPEYLLSGTPYVLEASEYQLIHDLNCLIRKHNNVVDRLKKLSENFLQEKINIEKKIIDKHVFLQKMAHTNPEIINALNNPLDDVELLLLYYLLLHRRNQSIP